MSVSASTLVFMKGFKPSDHQTMREFLILDMCNIWRPRQHGPSEAGFDEIQACFEGYLCLAAYRCLIYGACVTPAHPSLGGGVLREGITRSRAPWSRWQNIIFAPRPFNMDPFQVHLPRHSWNQFISSIFPYERRVIFWLKRPFLTFIYHNFFKDIWQNPAAGVINGWTCHKNVSRRDMAIEKLHPEKTIYMECTYRIY